MLLRLSIFAAVVLATCGAATAQVKVRIGDLAQSLNEIGSRAMIDLDIAPNGEANCVNCSSSAARNPTTVNFSAVMAGLNA